MYVPTATYRLQFTDSFGFSQAQQIVDYLSQLGISHIYASPIFKARSGSQHGYDVVDQNQINPELGGPGGFESLVGDLQAKKMGWLQDIVPNHMAYDSQNPYLMDVLEYGPQSEYADYFDIDWNHVSSDIYNKVLAPVLGSPYGECLEGGEIQLSYGESGLQISYYSFKAPIRIESYPDVFGETQSDDNSQLSQLLSKIAKLDSKLSGQALKAAAEDIKRSLWKLYETDETVKAAVDKAVSHFNGEPGKAASFDLLDKLILQQYYRPCHWKVSSEELNYRRFFTVNELISVKVEQPSVFKQTHALIKALVEEKKFNGLRIDHIDGLYDPHAYLNLLKEQMGDVYIIVEKILEADEKLPTNWPIQGTSGYEFLTCVNQLFCASKNEAQFTALYHDFIGSEPDYTELVLEKKQLLAETNFIGDIDNLSRDLKAIAVQYRHSRDLTLPRLRQALQAVMVCFPIYCTYIDQQGASERDSRYVKEAIAKARSRTTDLDLALDFIEQVLLLQYGEVAGEAVGEVKRSQWLHFVMKVQQFTGPLMAKGLEDTLFYIYNRFIGLNEVGGSPDEFGISVADFHDYHQYKQQHWPHMLNTTSTHDTKRSEDVRARLNVISELPEQWKEQVTTWRQFNADKVRYDNGQESLDPNDEYFLYQTLVGAYPFNEEELPQFKERVKAYVVKAVREAKVNSDWSKTDEAYESAYTHLVETLLTETEDNTFLTQLRAFYHQIMPYGIYNSLSQLLIKLTVPGAADMYQGTELWDLSLVDPDNRRPVDYSHRMRLLDAIKQGWQTDSEQLLKDMLGHKEDGRIKQFVTLRALAARQHFSEVFEQGDYVPLKAVGPASQNVVAYSRTYNDRAVIVVVPRFLTSLIGPDELPCTERVWKDTAIELPEGANNQKPWTNWLSNRAITTATPPIGKLLLKDVFSHFPVALLANSTP